jgi:hypothetical protein
MLRLSSVVLQVLACPGNVGCLGRFRSADRSAVAGKTDRQPAESDQHSRPGRVVPQLMQPTVERLASGNAGDKGCQERDINVARSMIERLENDA